MSSDSYIGEIALFAGNFAPRGWAFCDGQLLSVATHAALFSIIGSTYGGDGKTTFALPDLRGRVPIHAGHGPGLAEVSWGQKGGVESNTLAVANLPAHAHDVAPLCSAGLGDQTKPIANVPAVVDVAGTAGKAYSAKADQAMAASTSSSVGGGAAFENRQPFLGVRYVIALVGVFPSRN